MPMRAPAHLVLGGGADLKGGEENQLGNFDIHFLKNYVYYRIFVSKLGNLPVNSGKTLSIIQYNHILVS